MPASGTAQDHEDDGRHGQQQCEQHQDPGAQPVPRTAPHDHRRHDRRRQRCHRVALRAPQLLILAPALPGRAIETNFTPPGGGTGGHARRGSPRGRLLGWSPTGRTQPHGLHRALPGARCLAAFDLHARKLELRDDTRRKLDPGRLKLAVSHRLPAAAAQDVQQLCLLLVARQGPLFGRGTRSTAPWPDARGPTSCERDTTNEWPTARIMTPASAGETLGEQENLA